MSQASPEIELNVPLGSAGGGGGSALADLATPGHRLVDGGMRLRKQRSLWGNAFRQFRRHRLAMAGAIVFGFLVVVVFVGASVNPEDVNSPYAYAADEAPSMAHPFGTDALGQDMFSRILWGGRVSLGVGIVAAAFAVGVGTVVGAIAGFFGGAVDSTLMRLTDMFISLPQLALLLLVSFLFKQSIFDTFEERFGSGNLGIFVLIVIVISALSWMPTARLVRASFLSAKEKEFVEAARAIGATRGSIIAKHILPNVMSPIIVAATLAVGAAIITESALSFLGLGFPSDVPTWGTMLFEARDRFTFALHEALFPGLMIFLTVLAINYVGDGLRDALDPRKTQ